MICKKRGLENYKLVLCSCLFMTSLCGPESISGAINVFQTGNVHIHYLLVYFK